MLNNKEKFHYWSGLELKNMQGNAIFVFGSNPEGRHGMGAAKAAMRFGAHYGIGRGHVGNTYALPTKNLKAGYVEPATGIEYPLAGEKSISLEQIKENIKDLYIYANRHKELSFYIAYKAETRNLNGYTSEEMLDQFLSMPVPTNVIFHESFEEMIESKLSQ